MSLVSNALRGATAFITGLLLARWLGPEDYGRMAFLLASFLAFKQLLDMGSSSAFFTFLSQRPRSPRFVRLYLLWLGGQFVFSFTLVALALPDQVIQAVWQGEPRVLVILAMAATFMQGVVWPVASQMAEASRETLRVQRLNTIMVLLHLAIVIAIWTFGLLVLPLIFLAMAAEWMLAGWLAARMYRSEAGAAAGQAETTAKVWREYWSFCAPLIPYSLLGFAHDFASRWMLQRWGGPSEQAYFGVAQQFANVALLATASILRIFWKEIAEAHHLGDRERVAQLYQKVSRMLYFVGAVMAGGLLPWAGEILKITVGSSYAGAGVTLMLMFLYPVHQSMGQIGGTMLRATGHVPVQVVIGIVFMTCGLVAAYLAMAPVTATIPGLGLASKGLAWRMLILQLIEVNVVAFVIARIFAWRYDWHYQAVGLAGCIALGWIAHSIVEYLLGESWPALPRMVAATLLYLLGVGGFLLTAPWVAGIRRLHIATRAT